MAKKRVVILGATGSIGRQTIDVCSRLCDEFEVVGATAHSQVDELRRIAKLNRISKTTTATDSLCDFIDECEPDIVVNSLVGAIGAKCSLHTLKTNARLALANKESLVVAGDILMPLVKRVGQLLPIDSEHGAIFQCLQGERAEEVSKLWITCSGGPFFGKKKEDLKTIKASDALKHPTWDMGAKITIDSATLMNKGLEVIEAHHLFGIDYDDIKVAIHPQSVIHSMVEFKDASVKAHLGTTDMRIPIQYALTYPERAKAPVEALDFTKLKDLTFDEPDMQTFSCLELAYAAGRAGGTLPCAMNAANEVANAAFRSGKCGFLDIENCVRHVMSTTKAEEVTSFEQLQLVDKAARELATSFLSL